MRHRRLRSALALAALFSGCVPDAPAECLTLCDAVAEAKQATEMERANAKAAEATVDARAADASEAKGAEKAEGAEVKAARAKLKEAEARRDYAAAVLELAEAQALMSAGQAIDLKPFQDEVSSLTPKTATTSASQ